MRLLPYSAIGLGIALCVVAAACDDEGEDIPGDDSPPVSTSYTRDQLDAMSAWELLLNSGIPDAPLFRDGGKTSDADACFATQALGAGEWYPNITITLFTTRSADEAQALYGRLKIAAPPMIYPWELLDPGATMEGLQYEYGGGTGLYIEGAQVLQIVSELSDQQQADYDRIQSQGDDAEHAYGTFRAFAQWMVPALGEHVRGGACGETPPDITPTVQVTPEPQITATLSAAALDQTSAKGLIEKDGGDYGGPWVDDGIVAGDEACLTSRVHNEGEYPDTTVTLFTATDEAAAASLFSELNAAGPYPVIGPVQDGLPSDKPYVYGDGVSIFQRGAQVLLVVTTLTAEGETSPDPSFELTFSQTFAEQFGQFMTGAPCR